MTFWDLRSSFVHILNPFTRTLTDSGDRLSSRYSIAWKEDYYSWFKCRTILMCHTDLFCIHICVTGTQFIQFDSWFRRSHFHEPKTILGLKQIPVFIAQYMKSECKSRLPEMASILSRQFSALLQRFLSFFSTWKKQNLLEPAVGAGFHGGSTSGCVYYFHYPKLRSQTLFEVLGYVRTKAIRLR